MSWTCPHRHLLVLLPRNLAISKLRSYFHLLSFYLVAKYGWKLITRPLLVSNSKEAPAYHLRIQSLLVVVFIFSAYPTDLVNDKWFPATDIWTAKSYKKPLFEPLMGDPDQMFSLREFELSPILSTSVNTNAPSSTIAECLWLLQMCLWKGH